MSYNKDEMNRTFNRLDRFQLKRLMKSPNVAQVPLQTEFLPLPDFNFEKSGVNTGFGSCVRVTVCLFRLWS